MTGNGHIQLFKVTSYLDDQTQVFFKLITTSPSGACSNSYPKLQAGVLYTSLPIYTTLW